MRQLLKISCLLTVTILSLSNAHAQLDYLKVKNYSVESYSILKMHFTMSVTIVNDTDQFDVLGAHGLIYQKQKPLVCLDAQDITIPHGTNTLLVTARVSRCSDASIWRLLFVLLHHNINEITADISATIKYQSGHAETKTKENISATRLIK